MKFLHTYGMIAMLVVGFLLVSAPTFAAMRAVFPNSKSLQPLPTQIKPNISGNVNGTVGQGDTPAIPEVNTSPLNGTVDARSNDGYINDRSLSFLSYIFISVIVLVCIALVVLWYKGKRV